MGCWHPHLPAPTFVCCTIPGTSVHSIQHTWCTPSRTFNPCSPHKVLRCLGLDTHRLVLLTPKLLQACIATYTDYHVWRLAGDVFGSSVATATIACQLLAWFNAYCLVRTYSNSCEAGLVVHALRHYFYLVQSTSRGQAWAHAWRWAVLGVVSVVLRPPCALFWAPLGITDGE